MAIAVFPVALRAPHSESRAGSVNVGACFVLDKRGRSHRDHSGSNDGVGGYQIEAMYADALSKPDVATDEAVRLIEREKVNMLLGDYSSAQCVPAATASVHVRWEKIKIAALSATMTGFAEMLYRQYQMCISPDTVSGIPVSLQMVFIIFLPPGIPGSIQVRFAAQRGV